MVGEHNGQANANRDRRGSLEIWIILNPANVNDRSKVDFNKKATFKTIHNKYLVAEGDGRANANRTQIGAWEKWSILSQ